MGEWSEGGVGEWSEGGVGEVFSETVCVSWTSLEYYLVFGICPLVPVKVVHKPLLQWLQQSLHG